MHNPFSLSFGKEPKSIINRYEQFDIIKNDFTIEESSNNTYLITGIRGSGKTVLLTRLEKYFGSLKDWIVVDLNPELDMIEMLASAIYEKSNSKFKFLNKNFSFSFSGLSISISGENPVSNVYSLLEKMLEVIKNNNKHILICIDEVSNNSKVKQFIQQFQIFIRKDYPLYLLMTGLYENVRNLQNEKSLTFLYRAPQIKISSLSLISIAETYKSELNIPYEEAVNLSKLTKGYAFAYQVLGYILFDKKNKSINEDIINQFDTYLREYVYEKIYYDLSDMEKQIVLALASYENDKMSSIIEKTKIKKGNISQYRDKLIKKGVLINAGWGKVDFILPRFREYLLLQKEFE